ncbi:MAG: GNAT family N-acetyltransferase [Actinocrinis sp.]
MADNPTADALFATAAAGWGFAESSRVDGWRLRAAGGFTHRANSAWPIGPLERSLPDAIAEVRSWYLARRLRPLIQVVVGSDLDVKLDGLGHHETRARALRQTANVEKVLDTLLSVAPIGVKEAYSDAPSEDWLALYRSGDLPPAARQVLGSGDRVQFATVYDSDSGEPVAIGRAALSAAPDSDLTPTWVGLSAIETSPAARRRGLAKLVVDALLEWAGEHGATDAYLEVTPDNAPAIAMYDALGFTTHHEYHYRVIA